MLDILAKGLLTRGLPGESIKQPHEARTEEESHLLEKVESLSQYLPSSSSLQVVWVERHCSVSPCPSKPGAPYGITQGIWKHYEEGEHC